MLTFFSYLSNFAHKYLSEVFTKNVDYATGSLRNATSFEYNSFLNNDCGLFPLQLLQGFHHLLGWSHKMLQITTIFTTIL